MSALFCPHCEKPLGEEHDENACRRKMSRRFFFGLAIAPLAVAIASKLPGVRANNAAAEVLAAVGFARQDIPKFIDSYWTQQSAKLFMAAAVNRNFDGVFVGDAFPWPPSVK